MNDLETLREQVLALPIIERERLMEDILASFSPTGQAAIGAAWLDEIESRRKGYAGGQIPTISLDESRRRLGI